MARASHGIQDALQTREVAITAAAGVGAGIAARLAASSEAEWLSEASGFLPLWVFAVALIGATAPATREAGLRAGAFFVALCCAFDAWGSVLEDSGFPYSAAVWILLALTAAPLAAAGINHCARRPDVIGGAGMAAAAAIILGDGLLMQLYQSMTDSGDDSSLDPVHAVVGVLCAATIIGVFPKYPSTKIWALVLTIPMVWVAGFVTEWVYGFINAVSEMEGGDGGGGRHGGHGGDDGGDDDWPWWRNPWFDSSWIGVGSGALWRHALTPEWLRTRDRVDSPEE